MTEFEFTIVASGFDPNAEDFETRFYDAGCDDATVSFQRGSILIDFDRKAESAESAIGSAVKDVIAAGASVLRIEPDPFVTLSDMAARSGLTRAALTQYAKGQRGQAFPRPVMRITCESPLWNWPATARWLADAGRLDAAAVELADAIAKANAALVDKDRPASDFDPAPDFLKSA